MWAYSQVKVTDEKPIGKVTHYYDKIQVAVLSLTKPLKISDKIRFLGHNEFTQEVTSMQLDHKSINSAKPKQEFGLKVDKPVAKNDKIFKA